MPNNRWTWDQGRLEYFNFESLRAIAKVLVALDNVPLAGGPDPLRGPLTLGTGLPFLPGHYRVWRNYKRVFGLALLAGSVGGKMICTDVCHALSDPSSPIQTADDYLSLLVSRTFFPTPVLQGYSATGRRVYPFAAILRALLANALNDIPQLSLTEIFERVIGNNLTGGESLGKYATVQATARRPFGDELRQVRELVTVLSQFSFLKWKSPNLLLDVEVFDSQALDEIIAVATPSLDRRKNDPEEELLALGGLKGALPRRVSIIAPVSSEEETGFLEGSRKAGYHLRTERSPALRLAFFDSKPEPWYCDVCRLDPPTRYPWAGNILELHHLLPLASAVKLGRTETKLIDLVPVCPNCHRATHAFYRKWLKMNEASDFADGAQAAFVYETAKAAVRL